MVRAGKDCKIDGCVPDCAAARSTPPVQISTTVFNSILVLLSGIEQQPRQEPEDYGAVTIKIVGPSLPFGRKRVTVNITNMLAGVARLRDELQKLEAAEEQVRRQRNLPDVP
jgi:hypothetical protein